MSTETETPSSETQQTETGTEPTPPTPESTTQPVVTTEPAPEFVPLTTADLFLPEGHTLDPTLSTEFLDVINNQEMSAADRANALIALQAKVLTAASEASSAAWDQTQTEWQNEVKTAYGDKLVSTMESVAKLVEEFGSPELRQVFDLTGAGNNVHMVRFLSTLASKLTEGGGPMPGTPASTLSPAQRMFPSMKA